MNANVAPFTPTLESVQLAFAHWRENRTERGRTPVGLQRQAVALLEQHRAVHICQALGIHAKALRQWSRSTRPALTDTPADNDSPLPAFITLPRPDEQREEMKTETAVSSLVFELPNGVRLRTDVSCSLTTLLESLAAFAGQARP